jgi:hypothetical protein
MTSRNKPCKNPTEPYCYAHTRPEPVIPAAEKAKRANTNVVEALITAAIPLLDKNRSDHDQSIAQSIRSIEIATRDSWIQDLYQKETGSYMSREVREFVDARIKGAMTMAVDTNDPDTKLVVTSLKFLKLILPTVPVLVARDRASQKKLAYCEERLESLESELAEAKAVKSYKEEWCLATQKIGSLKKLVKEKNLELEVLRSTKTERKEIKRLQRELEEYKLYKAACELEQPPPPAYTE